MSMWQALGAWVQARLEKRLRPLIQALERERERLFDALVLTGLGLMLSAISVCSALLLLWWSLSEPARLVVMACAITVLGLAGLMLLVWARLRWVRPR